MTLYELHAAKLHQHLVREEMTQERLAQSVHPDLAQRLVKMTSQAATAAVDWFKHQQGAWSARQTDWNRPGRDHQIMNSGAFREGPFNSF